MLCLAAMLFVNLAVKDLDKSIEFFIKLGFKFNPQFNDKNATCMIVGDESFVMLLVEPFFQSFTKRPLVDAQKSNEALIAVSFESRQQVDDMFNNAIAAGGTSPREKQDYGWMYQQTFQDLDGHWWEPFWMDVSKMPKRPEK